LRETIVDGETGILVAPRDPAALACAIRGLLDDPARRAAMGAAGRRRVASAYDWRQVVSSILALYAEVSRQKALMSPAISES
jgi:D-inositol-3-phosphate glycosyltransferase